MKFDPLRLGISRRILTYALILLFFFAAGFLLSSYIVSKSIYYAQVLNCAGRIRGDIQRFAKLYFAGEKLELKSVAKEIDENFRILDKKVESLKLPLIDNGKNFQPVLVYSCWRHFKWIVLEDKAPKEKVLLLSEDCWNVSDKQVAFYQEIAQRNLVILNILYYLIFLTALFVIGLLLRISSKEVLAKLEKRANLDALTGALNRGAFEDLYKSFEIGKYFQPVSLILFDIDDFKKVNDTFGHNVGDKVLRTISETVKKQIRRSDLFVRWGGEEFLVVLPHTDLNGARVVAEKIRKAIASLKIPELRGKKVSASFGVTSILSDEPIEDAVFRADVALYRAKKLGKNRVEVSPPVEKRKNEEN